MLVHGHTRSIITFFSAIRLYNGEAIKLHDVSYQQSRTESIYCLRSLDARTTALKNCREKKWQFIRGIGDGNGKSLTRCMLYASFDGNLRLHFIHFVHTRNEVNRAYCEAVQLCPFRRRSIPWYSQALCMCVFSFRALTTFRCKDADVFRLLFHCKRNSINMNINRSRVQRQHRSQ